MIWTIISIIFLSLIKIVLTCMPSGIVESILRRFEIHSKLNSENTQITKNGELLKGEEKERTINRFNNAILMKRHYIFPGTEERYINPEDNNHPIVIETKIGKKNIRIKVFTYNDRMEVVKQYDKKMIAYSLFADKFE